MLNARRAGAESPEALQAERPSSILIPVDHDEAYLDRCLMFGDPQAPEPPTRLRLTKNSSISNNLAEAGAGVPPSRVGMMRLKKDWCAHD